jgi:hypothetical protein
MRRTARYLAIGLAGAAALLWSLNRPSPDRRIAGLRAVFDRPASGDSRQVWFIRHDRLVRELVRDPAACDAAIGSVAAVPPGGGSEFVGTLEGAVLRALIERNDDVRLRTLFSQVPYEADGPDGYPIEYALVDPELNRSVTGILVLFDAYARSQRQPVRESLADSIRRAFYAEVGDAPLDAASIDRCRGSFESRERDLKANLAWRTHYGSVPYKSAPLFIAKTGPDRIPEP